MTNEANLIWKFLWGGKTIRSMWHDLERLSLQSTAVYSWHMAHAWLWLLAHITQIASNNTKLFFSSTFCILYLGYERKIHKSMSPVMSDCQDITSSTLDKMAPLSQTAVSNPFSCMKHFLFWFKFHRSLFLGVQLTINQHWFRQWLGAKLATSNYLNQCWFSSLTHICSTRGRWVNVIAYYILQGWFTGNGILHIWDWEPFDKQFMSS